MPHCPPIPSSGSRIALAKDKQHELAHAVRYDGLTPPWQKPQRAGYHTPNADAPLRIFLALNLRDSMTEDNVRKRPFLPVKIDPHALWGNPSLFATVVQDYYHVGKNTNCSVISKKKWAIYCPTFYTMSSSNYTPGQSSHGESHRGSCVGG